MKTSIISATDNDLIALTEMGMNLWPGHDFYELKDDFNQKIQSDNNRIFMYLEDETPIGFIYISIRTDYVEGSRSSPTGYVEGIYVNPDKRRKGYSKELLLKGEKWLKEKGCSQVGSDIEMGNETSYQFHKSIGFQEKNRLIAFIKDI